MPDDSGEAIDQIIPEDIPEFYTDGYKFAASPYTVNLVFTVGTGTGNFRDVVNVRMSPGHAKVMAILFERNIKAYEEQLGIEIPIPQAILERHDIDPTVDW